MAHAAPGRRRGASDEADDGLLVAGLDEEFRAFLLGRAADLANHDDGFGRVVFEELAEADNSYLSAVEVELDPPPQGGDLYRVGEVAIYSVDALCRRSEVLQKTAHADNDFVGMNPDDAGSRGFEDGRQVKVSQAQGQVTLRLRICNELPLGAVWVKSATNAAKVLGDSFGPIGVEAA